MGIFAPINAGTFPTNDVAVRRAILYAVDKQGRGAPGRRRRLPGQQHAAGQGHARLRRGAGGRLPFDPAKAAAVLKAAGWTKPGEFWEKDGKRLTLTLTAHLHLHLLPAARAGDPGLPAQGGHGRQRAADGHPRLARRQHQGATVAHPAAVHRRGPGRAAAVVHPRPVLQLEPRHRPRADRPARSRAARDRPCEARRALRAGAEDHHGPGDGDADPREHRSRDDHEEADRPDLVGRRVRVFRRGVDVENEPETTSSTPTG